MHVARIRGQAREWDPVTVMRDETMQDPLRTDPYLTRGDPGPPTAGPTLPEGLSTVDRLEWARADMSRRWRAGDEVPVEVYLQPSILGDGGRSTGFDLIRAEIVVRRELGRASPLEDYLGRFPEHADRLREQFDDEAAMVPETIAESGTPDPVVERRPSAFPEIHGYENVAEIGRGGWGSSTRPGSSGSTGWWP